MIRKSAVSGSFYPEDKKKLLSDLKTYSPEVKNRIAAPAALVPHAGYIFSGSVAGEVFSRIKVPETVIILNPSHYYAEPPIALWKGQSWETPLGVVDIHERLCDEIASLNQVQVKNSVHHEEHAGEVVLPFLQYHSRGVKIVVICVAVSATDRALMEFGSRLGNCIENAGGPETLVVASSDMSHESGPNARQVVENNDAIAIGHMQKLDPEGLLNACREKQITMCGAGPAAVAMQHSVEKTAVKGELISHATSSDSPYGRDDYIVGYAGMAFH